MIATILTFIIILAVLVLVHELGHFLTARFFGIEVEEFGFGFPPKFWSIKKGKTVYSLNWIPLGGFVRIKGEDKPHLNDPGSFGHKPAHIRALVIGAGVFMNLLLSSLLFTIGYSIGLPQLAEDLPSYARTKDVRVQIIETVKGFPAETAGLRPGDVIMTLDGQSFATVGEIQSYVAGRAGTPVRTEIRRGKEILAKEIVPAVSEQSGKPILGVALVETAIVSYPIHIAAWKGVSATGYYVKEIVSSFGDLIKNLVTQKKSDVEFSGPVGIAVLTGRVAKLGFVYLLQFAALLSVNLAVINILPIPALDGGRLLFIIIEKFRGHAVRPKIEAAVHKIAFLLLLGLVLLVTIKDIERYKTQILDGLKSLFGVT
jgi:regulator of sigma E protease